MTKLRLFNTGMLGALVICGFLVSTTPLLANIPGGGTGTGANVTLTDIGGTVTLANGLVSIVITKTSAEIDTVNYTFNNNGSTRTTNVLASGSGGGYLYWFQNGGSFIAGPFTESVVANNGNYAEVSLSYASPTNGIMEIHYSMMRGSPGFYTTAILTHRTQDGLIHIELRPNIYAGAQFNWMSVDATRNRLMQVSGGSAIGVQGAPVECSLWTNGIYSGQYEDKYKYTADLAGLSAWGWSSVGTGGENIGLWNITASPEYYPGGPMERSLMEHVGTTILNVFTGGYFGLGTDNNFLNGEIWTKVYGPYLYYCNNVTNTITGTNQAAQALFNDALAQGEAEQSAWPYSWFTNANYARASQRGAVSGQFVISDSGNPNASASNMWVGVVRQPVTSAGIYDFQEWARPYQFWVQTDANGNFIIPNVIASNNYTLYAFGSGAEGTFMSQNQTGGNPSLLFNLPASPFSLTVTGGATTNLGTIIWTPSRVGPTVFEIGYPDRTAGKFRHGDDWWVGDIGPNPTNPLPVWSKWLEYPFDFPSGPNYIVGQSRWTTDWNFCQPVVVDSQGNYNDSTSTITFNLATIPAGSQASLFVGLTSDYYAALVVRVNGTILVSGSGGVTATPSALPSSGFVPTYSRSDTTIREGNNGANSDERITFPATLLRTNLPNTITFTTRQVGGSYFADHAMYDYLRLELTGYVPPAPASATAYAGNNCNLVCWPVTPGATSYNILRSTTSGSGYVSITNGVIGPVCGSGYNNATYLDTNAANGMTYYYVVQSVNPVNHSSSSPQSDGTTPDAGIAASAPATPTGLSVTGVGHQSVTLNWTASTSANFYTVFRSTLVNSGGGSSNTLSTIVLANNVTYTSYTDTSPTDGSIYSYSVTATGAGGTSGNSASAAGVPVPAPPASAPASLTGNFVQTTNVALGWSPVPGAIGYVISRSTAVKGKYALVQSITETNYIDVGVDPSTSVYYYHVTAVNAGGVSTNATEPVNSQQPAPTNLFAVAGNAQITLTWPDTGASGYAVGRGTISGKDTTFVTVGYSGTSFTDTGVTNGVKYYYVVIAQGYGGNSGNSPEASATPFAPSLTWSGAASSTWDTVTTNWLDGATATAYADGDDTTFNDTTKTNLLITDTVTPGSVTFANATVNYGVTAGGAGISGATSLVKTNGGVLTLNNANAYSGGTTVNGGTLLVNNLTGSGTGSGAVTVNAGGALGGTGSIAGAVTVNGGGALAPGNPPGTLTIGNNLTLAAGSTTIIQVQHSPLTNNAVIVSGILTNGGTLVVSNSGVAAFGAGDRFNVFSAAAYAGGFDSLSLPSLDPGLFWSTAWLTVNGTLGVVSTSPPVIGNVGLAGASLVLQGSGGTPNWYYRILSSTNLTTAWTPVATNQFDPGGNFHFTNNINPNQPQMFYRLQLQ